MDLFGFDVLYGAQIRTSHNIHSPVYKQCYHHTPRQEHYLLDLSLSSLATFEHLELGFSSTIWFGPNRLIVSEDVSSFVTEDDNIIT